MVLSISNSEMEKNLPPGFRFHPTDEELITYYLSNKVSDVNFATRAVADVDLNKCEPWDLPGKASMGEKEWYFFSMRDRKYPTGLRTNRATNAGYWKTTGKDKEIYHSGVLAGMKKTLVFYKGRAPKGEKSNWVMHEYRLHTKFAYKPTKEEWVICRVFQKSATGKKPQPTPPSFPHLLSSPCDPTIVNDLGEIGIPHLNNLVSSTNGFNAISTNNNSESNRMNMNMNWAYTSPSSLLTSNYSSNSTLLRAMQFNSYQHGEAANASLNNFMTQGESCFAPNPNANFPASSSKGIDYPEQQPFNLESFW